MSDAPAPASPSSLNLRRGWTTGACAAAATRAAYEGLITGIFPDPVTIRLPGGQTPAFALAFSEITSEFSRAAIVKDAGDDPDVTHGATIIATLRRGQPGSGIIFRAGTGVGTVTLPGLPLAAGEPAINPVPRAMMEAAIAAASALCGSSGDVIIEISVPNGERLAERTLNGRLGIIGGLSILGTTGIVIPYSCAAWIDSIHRGVDVARALGLSHIAGSTGSTSEAGVRALYNLEETALIEMGDFAGGFLKYVRSHPVSRVTLAGGLAKFSKLAQGFLDLHSARGPVDRDWLADCLAQAGGDTIQIAQARKANSALEIWQIAAQCGNQLAHIIAKAAWQTAQSVLGSAQISLDIVIFDRAGHVIARYNPDETGA